MRLRELAEDQRTVGGQVLSRSLPMIAGCRRRGMFAGMKQLADEAEKIVTAKLNEDVSCAVTDRSLAAASHASVGPPSPGLLLRPGHPAYNKARDFNIDDVDHLPAVFAFFAEAGLPPLIEVWTGDASATLGQRLAHPGFYAAEVNVTLEAWPGRSTSATFAAPAASFH